MKKGDLLVQLDPRDAQYALDEGQSAAEELRVRLGLDESKEFDVDEVPEVEAAKLALELAEKNYHRAEKPQEAKRDRPERRSIRRRRNIARPSSGTSLAVLQAKQLYQSYRSALTHLVTLRKALDDCSIRAPFDGWVAERDISVGERVISHVPRRQAGDAAADRSPAAVADGAAAGDGADQGRPDRDLPDRRLSRQDLHGHGAVHHAGR